MIRQVEGATRFNTRFATKLITRGGELFGIASWVRKQTWGRVIGVQLYDMNFMDSTDAGQCDNVAMIDWSERTSEKPKTKVAPLPQDSGNRSRVEHRENGCWV